VTHPARTILGISGSLRRDSHNTALLRNAARLLPGGVRLELWDPEALKAIPPYDQDDDANGQPEPVTALRHAIEQADAVLFSTPEYNSSIPGQLKNALDWLSRPMSENPVRNKPVAVVGASTGAFGAVWAQAELRKVLGTLGARVTEGELAVGHAHERIDADGLLADADQLEQLSEVVTDLVRQVELRERLAVSAA
jgi:chromate reductase, NAD(P)H dehydrogenase (quinone)